MIIGKKVLYVLGGIPHYTAPLLERIVAKGYQITMLIPYQKDTQAIGQGVKLVDNHTTYQVRNSRVKKAWYSKSFLVDLNAILLEEKPDILITCWPYFLQLFFERKLIRTIKKLGIKLMIREIPFQVPPFGNLRYFKKNPIFNENMELMSKGLVFYFRTLITMYIRKYIYSHADAALNYTSAGLELLPSYGVNRQNIFVTFNTTDTDSLLKQYEMITEQPPIMEVRPRILHIGRLVKWKRVDLLIDAYHLIFNKYPNSELVIIGNGPENDNLNKQVIALGIEQNVRFTGGIYDSETLAKYMYESTVYVLAGMGGLSINDAMCFGLPVICSVCDGTERDLVIEGRNGYYFESGNVQSLSSKLDQLLSDPVKAKKMGLESFSIIKDNINLETVSDRYVNAFNSVLGK